MISFLLEFQRALSGRPHPVRLRRGVSTTETIVVTVICAVVITISAAALSRARQARAHAQCAVNLRNIGFAIHTYAAENGEVYPMPSTAAQWEDLLRKYVSRATFACPADQELFPALGSSYDWRDVADPPCSLAGKSATVATRSGIPLAYDAMPGWHVPGRVHVVNIDVAVYLMDEEALLRELQTPIRPEP